MTVPPLTYRRLPRPQMNPSLRQIPSLPQIPCHHLMILTHLANPCPQMIPYQVYPCFHQVCPHLQTSPCQVCLARQEYFQSQASFLVYCHHRESSDYRRSNQLISPLEQLPLDQVPYCGGFLAQPHLPNYRVLLRRAGPVVPPP